MKIVFGWNLDGLVFPENISGSQAAFDSQICGPLAFLSLIETRLGLKRPPQNRALRIADYLSALKITAGNHFFSAALKNDPWTTADHLLSIRDELVASGWKKEILPDAARMPPKLKSLAEVERSFKSSGGFAERLQALAAALQNRPEKLIEAISLLEPISLYPYSFQQLFELLRHSGTGLSEIPLKANAESGDLQLLQARILGKLKDEKLELSGDGSITIIDADDEMQAALCTAAWLSEQESLEQIVIIRSSDPSQLSHACRRVSLPSIGTEKRSHLKALLQILPLAFAICLRPVDPMSLVQFLTIPDGPIPNWISRKLLAALSDSPGIDGTGWQQAWSNCSNKQSQFIAGENPELSSAEAAELARKRIETFKDWFRPFPADNSNSISRQSAEEICMRIEQFAQSRLIVSKNRSLNELLLAQTKMLRQLLALVGEPEILLVQLHKMIETVTAYGASLSSPEASRWALVDKPGQIWAQADTVLWWGFAQSQWDFPQRPYWSETEIAFLKHHNIFLDSLLLKLRRDSYTWRLPLLNAKNKLLLVRPRLAAGERTTAHPLWDELSGIINKKSISAITVHANEIFKSGQLKIAGKDTRANERELQKLPGALRTWKLPARLIKQRHSESFSSIEKMLGCPLAYVLQYSGGMYIPKTLDLPQKQLLLGKLAHAVINEMYETKKYWGPEEGRNFARETVERLIPEMAAMLLLPGSSPQLREAMEAIPNSVYELIKYIDNASARVEGTEVTLSAPFCNNSELKGNIDMLLRLADGQPLLLDFKWSSSPYYYRKRLVEGKALQLAIYSYLTLQQKEKEQSRPETSSDENNKILKLARRHANVLELKAKRQEFPPAGYFMFRHSELFFTGEGIFPAYTHVRKMERDLSQTFNLITEAYQRTNEAIQNGELVASEVDKDNASIDVFMHPQLVDNPCGFCKFGHFCGKKELS